MMMNVQLAMDMSRQKINILSFKIESEAENV